MTSSNYCTPAQTSHADKTKHEPDRCPADAQEDLVMGSNRRGRAPRCLVLAPTRELAQQVQREFQTAAPTLSCGAFYGGMTFHHLRYETRRYPSHLLHLAYRLACI